MGAQRGLYKDLYELGLAKSENCTQDEESQYYSDPKAIPENVIKTPYDQKFKKLSKILSDEEIKQYIAFQQLKQQKSIKVAVWILTIIAIVGIILGIIGLYHSYEASQAIANASVSTIY